VAVVLSILGPFVLLGQQKNEIAWGAKYNSVGASLVLKEAGRDRINGRTVITYHLFAAGLPADSGYVLWTRPIGGAPQDLGDVFLSKDGLVVTRLANAAKGITENPVELKVSAARGEVKQIALVGAENADQKAFGDIIPFPLDRVADRCHISAIMVDRDYSGVMVNISGLPPNEEFQLEQHSGNEGGKAKVTADINGNYRTLIFPFVKGQESGSLHLKVAAKQCAAELEVPWGKGSYVLQ
jgi:hypothetical protein